MGAAKQATGGLCKLVRVGGSARGVRPKYSRLSALHFYYKGNFSKDHSVGYETAKDSHTPAQGLYS